MTAAPAAPAVAPPSVTPGARGRPERGEAELEERQDLLPGPQDGPCAGGPEGGDLLGEGGGPQEVEQASGLHLLQDQHLGRDSVQGLEQHCLHVDS